ncbi:hypothetical protein [Paraclostridium bifermentans]|uniref:hypothetical protein n=1 Tax=Paraclostridium bifermentans TaxID=1490 RepID=UPI00241C46C9|nr:hypothetical protein [Paraclostridium bifermentans]
MTFGRKLNWQIQDEKNKKLKDRLNKEMKEVLWKNTGFSSEKEYNNFMNKNKNIYIID